MSDKYYVGFYEDKTLVAVMDLIDGYPNADTAYIGFFMMDPTYQGKQIGTAIISEVTDYLRSIGKTAVQIKKIRNQLISGRKTDFRLFRKLMSMVGRS